MIYYKTSQYVPGKGDAWMFYECNDDRTVRRYMTYIPSTRELDKVTKPFIRRLMKPETLMESSQEEFHQYWPPDANEKPTSQEVVANEIERKGIKARKYFDPNMTVGEAMAVHPRVAEVFAAFQLGGCSSCGISEVETVAQVTMGYGVDVDMLLDVLEELMAEEEAKKRESEQADVAEPAAADREK
jgi:hybrid cluster-associated redox disulfide protein